MNRTLAVLLLLTATLLGGCASSSPELRPYTADETRELALEALNRRGLSFEEYHAKKSRAAWLVAEKRGVRRSGPDECRAGRATAWPVQLRDCTAQSFAQLSVGLGQDVG